MLVAKIPRGEEKRESLHSEASRVRAQQIRFLLHLWERRRQQSARPGSLQQSCQEMSTRDHYICFENQFQNRTCFTTNIILPFSNIQYKHAFEWVKVKSPKDRPPLNLWTHVTQPSPRKKKIEIHFKQGVANSFGSLSWLTCYSYQSQS